MVSAQSILTWFLSKNVSSIVSEKINSLNLLWVNTLKKNKKNHGIERSIASLKILNKLIRQISMYKKVESKQINKNIDIYHLNHIIKSIILKKPQNISFTKGALKKYFLVNFKIVK